MTGPSVGSIFAGCRIEAIAGRGGMGVVYKATQVALERPVALKAIAPDVSHDTAFQERFKHEARLAASIDHPHVVPVYEAGEIDGQLYLVMRWVDGVDLRALIDRGPLLQPQRAARIGAQVASALAAAHARGLLHRDVKPANVLVASVDDAEHAYLTDFGIARYESATSGLTATGMMVGTIDYMAPERIEGKTGDGRSDIYSLGCALYELLTGQAPYVRENQGARMYAHLSAEVPAAVDSRPEVPGRLSDIARRAMAKSPEDRFETAGEMARALMAGATVPSPVAETSATRTVKAAAPPPPPPPPPLPKAPPAPAPTAKAPPTPVATEPAATDPLQPTPAAPAAPRPGRRPPVAWLAGGGLLAVVAVGVVLLASGGSSDTASDSSPSGSAGGSSGGDETLSSSAPESPITVPAAPDGLGSGSGTIWVTGSERGVMSRIDAVSGEKVGKPIPVGADPDTVAVGEDAVWVTNNDSDTVSRIDPSSGSVVAEIRIGLTPEGIFLDADAAPWVALIDDGGVRRIDPETNTPDPLVKTGNEPYAVLVDGETVWVTNRGGGTVSHFDRSDRQVSSVTVGGRPRALAVDGSSLWAIDFEDRLLEFNRETGRLRDQMPLEGEPREMVAAEGALWITLHRANELARFDLSTRDVTTRPVPGGPLGITAHAGRIWVGTFLGNTLTPFEP